MVLTTVLTLPPPAAGAEELDPAAGALPPLALLPPLLPHAASAMTATAARPGPANHRLRILFLHSRAAEMPVPGGCAASTGARGPHENGRPHGRIRTPSLRSANPHRSMTG